MQNILFQNCFASSLIFIILFSIFSFILCALPFETDKYRGTNLELAVQSESYQWWLLISIMVSTPSLILRFFDWIKALPNGYEERILHKRILLSRTLEVLVIALPNFVLYFCVVSRDSIDHALIANIQNALFYSQGCAIIGSIFLSTFGHKYKDLGSSNHHLNISVEKYTVVFLAFFAFCRMFLSLSSVVPTASATQGCLIMSSIFLTIGLIIMTYLVVIFTRYLTHGMDGFTFSDYDQMHDFYRMIGVTVFGCYTFAIYISTNQIISSKAVFQQDSQSLVLFLIGKVLFVIYLTVIDQQCALFEVTLKRGQLQARLDMIRYISHELRSPLNSSFIGLQLLRDNIELVLNTLISIKKSLQNSELTESSGSIIKTISKIVDEKESITETVELVKESSNIALETLNDMLTFDKIDEKKLVLEVEDVDVWTFVCETVRPFRINAMKEQMSLTSDCLDRESNWLQKYVIKADRFKLNQVLRNFLSNAMKFSPKKTGLVHVQVEKVPVPSRALFASESSYHLRNEMLRVSVTDNGCGIAVEDQKSLFGRYVQFNAGAQQKGGGSGLGLWISKNLIEMHGGVIGVRSEGEGCGSTFFFELPLHRRTPLSETIVHTSSPEQSDTPLTPLEDLHVPRISPSQSAAFQSDGSSSPDRQRLKPLTPTGVSISRLYRSLASNSPKLHPVDNKEATTDKDEESGLILSDGISWSIKAVPPSQNIPSTGNNIPEEGGRSSFPRLLRPRTSFRLVENISDKVADTSDKTQKLAEKPERSNEPRKLRVLIVDDTISTRKITAKMLVSKGLLVEEASDGLDFLRCLGIQPPRKGGSGAPSPRVHNAQFCVLDDTLNSAFDVILMDDNMPNMCGPDATALARAAGYKGLIIGVTGNSFESQLENFSLKGANKVFTKPLDIQKLQEAIHGHF